MAATAFEWVPSGDPVNELANMLEQVRWGEPLDGYQAYCLRECATWVRTGRVANPLLDTNLEDLLLVDVCDAILIWVECATDNALCERVKRSLEVYWQMMGMI